MYAPLRVAQCGWKDLEDLAFTRLLSFHGHHLAASAVESGVFCGAVVVLASYGDVDGCVEDLVDAGHLFG